MLSLKAEVGFNFNTMYMYDSNNKSLSSVVMDRLIITPLPFNVRLGNNALVYKDTLKQL